MSPTRFTVITTCLNRQHSVERTLCSVLDQGHDRVQYIVADRGSTDGSLDIIDLYADDLTVLKVPAASHAEALNAALEEATGEYILFIDDLLMPEALIALDRRLQKSHADWVFGEAMELDEFGNDMNMIAPQAPAALAEYLMHNGGMLPLEGACIRRELLQKVDGFDAVLLYAHAYDCWAQLIAGGHKPAIIELPISGHHEGGRTLTAAETLKQGLEFIYVARRYANRLSLREQAALWRNCDERQRIYALAEAELVPAEATRALWARLKSHPWWIMDGSVRQTLMRGVAHPAPAALKRAAA